jgi:WD40 repeat protein
VYDVAWSPIHPSVFACVDGAGRLDLWNLNKNFETPSAFIEVDNRTRALNKLKWSRKGTEIAVGDDHGEISIYELNESFACPQQHQSSSTTAANGGGENDFECFLKTLNTLKKLNQESINFSKSDYNNLNYLMDSFR